MISPPAVKRAEADCRALRCVRPCRTPRQAWRTTWPSGWQHLGGERCCRPWRSGGCFAGSCGSGSAGSSHSWPRRRLRSSPPSTCSGGSSAPRTQVKDDRGRAGHTAVPMRHRRVPMAFEACWSTGSPKHHRSHPAVRGCLSTACTALLVCPQLLLQVAAGLAPAAPPPPQHPTAHCRPALTERAGCDGRGRGLRQPRTLLHLGALAGMVLRPCEPRCKVRRPG